MSSSFLFFPQILNPISHPTKKWPNDLKRVNRDSIISPHVLKKILVQFLAFLENYLFFKKKLIQYLYLEVVSTHTKYVLLLVCQANKLGTQTLIYYETMSILPNFIPIIKHSYLSISAHLSYSKNNGQKLTKKKFLKISLAPISLCDTSTSIRF